MRTWIALALVLSAALSGCAGEESSTPDATPTTDDGGDQNQTATATSSSTTSAPAPGNETEPQPNTPPTAELTADAINGTAPLTVTFTLGGEDADGDALDWTLTVNGTQAANGTTLPATFTYNFTEAGNFSVVLAVTDGMNSTEANLTITVAAGAAGPEPVTYEGSVVLPDPWGIALDGCLMDAGRRDAGGPGGITGQDHPIEAAWYGWNYELDVSGVMAEFWSDEPAILGSGTSGTVPEGATYVVVCINDASTVDVDYTLTLSP